MLLVLLLGSEKVANGALAYLLRAGFASRELVVAARGSFAVKTNDSVVTEPEAEAEDERQAKAVACS
jgi:hypothetical protein